MHELAIMQNVVAVAGERAQDARVTVLRLEIGRLSAVEPEALRFCFELCALGTPLEGARLEITEIPGRARCESCGDELAIDHLVHLVETCPCGGIEMRVIAGQELRVKNMELV